MPRLSRPAGQNIRALATKRRTQAIFSFIFAGLILSTPIFFVKTLNGFLKELPIAPESTEVQEPNSHFLVYFYLYPVAIVIAVAPVARGLYLLKRAKHADQGAQGEEDTAEALKPLEQESWQIEYNLPLQGGLGDADIICVSPKGQAYVIDVKSHRGKVFTDGQHLQRRMGKSTHSFEKDFLSRAMRQALQVKKQKNYRFVTPILAFSNAKVSVPPGKLRGVYVVEKAKLVALLKSLG